MTRATDERYAVDPLEWQRLAIALPEPSRPAFPPHGAPAVEPAAPEAWHGRARAGGIAPARCDGRGSSVAGRAGAHETTAARLDERWPGAAADARRLNALSDIDGEHDVAVLNAVRARAGCERA
jgi:hypothetical protein